MSFFLKPFSLLYRAGIQARNSFYEKGVFKSHSLRVPTVSIGNITVGGTGKTPLVARVARILAESGERVCVLTRGYKRENSRQRVLVSDGEKILADVRKAGDEPFELAGKLLNLSAVIADADRAGAGNWARENLGITAFVLDDAFQHRRVKRDLDIVCIDATNPFGNKRLLPSGILREPLSNLERAGAIVITRANLIEEKQLTNLKIEISKLNLNGKIFVSRNKTARLIKLEEFNARSEPPAAADGLTPKEDSTQRRRDAEKNKTEEKENSLQINTDERGLEDKGRRTKDEGQSFFAFCALGNPESFFEQLRREKFDLVFTETFRDHHQYTRKDVERLEQKAAAIGAESFLTTAKDAVKLKDWRFNLPCYVVESELIFDDEESFRELISAAKGHEKNTKEIEKD